MSLLAYRCQHLTRLLHDLANDYPNRMTRYSKPFHLVFTLICLLLLVGFVSLLPAASSPYRLIVVLVVDGLAQEQVVRYQNLLSEGGFRRFLAQGAWFHHASYGHATTFTAVGHGTVLTGAHPYRHGLVGNEWLERETGEVVYCVEDPAERWLGHSTPSGAGTSPRNLDGTTLGDELRLATGFRSKVLSVSIKDRGAILLGGHYGTAYFFHSGSGQFISSSYYLEEYPDWWNAFYEDSPQDQWIGQTWDLLLDPQAYAVSVFEERPIHIDYRGMGKNFPHSLGKESGSDYYSAFSHSPFGNTYTLEFARAAVASEQLGKNAHQVPDLLAISLSPQDYVNHNYGPESAQSQDALLRLDRDLQDFLEFLDGWVGLEQTIVALTADHGFSASPEFLSEQGMEVGRINPNRILEDLNRHLSELFGQGEYATGWTPPTIYLDYSLMADRELSREDVEEASVDFLLNQPGIRHVYSRTALKTGQMRQNALTERVQNAWSPQRSGDLFVIQSSGWYLLGMDPNQFAATHGSVYAYDTNVPLMFLGPGFRPGKYGQEAGVVDLAPTLAYLLGLRPPSGNEGRVLTEALNVNR